MCQTRFPYPFAFLLFSPRHRYIFPTWRFSFRTTRLSRYSLINIIARQSCSSSCPSSPLMGNVWRADRFHPPPCDLSVNDFVRKPPLLSIYDLSRSVSRPRQYTCIYIKMDKFWKESLAETGNRERANETGGTPMHGRRGGGRTLVSRLKPISRALCAARC